MTEQILAEITLLDVEGNFVNEKSASIEFQNLGLRGPSVKQVSCDFSSGPVRFSLPSTGVPSIAILTTLYLPETQSFVRGSSSQIEITLRRRAQAWRAEFVSWSGLSNAFEALRSLLSKSPKILIVETGEELSYFTGDKYDAANSGAGALAKVTLLNLYYELSHVYEPIQGTSPLFSFVRSIEALGRDHLLALVDLRFADILAEVVQNQNSYPDWHELGTEPQRFYYPASYKARISATRHVRLNSSGNTIDITLDLLRNADFAVATFSIHGSPPAAHVAWGQMFASDNSLSHPFDVHEWLVQAARMSGPVPDLGYRLAPL